MAFFASNAAILARLARQLGADVPPRKIDPTWLLTLLSVLEVERYSLEDWNDALSAVLGNRILCPSYRTLTWRVQEAVLK